MNPTTPMLRGISLSCYVLRDDWSSRLFRPGQVTLTDDVPDILTRPRIDTGSWKATLETRIGGKADQREKHAGLISAARLA